MLLKTVPIKPLNGSEAARMVQRGNDYWYVFLAKSINQVVDKDSGICVVG